MRLLLARHGETEWNARGLIQGNQDIALNDNGRLQAKHLGMLLKARRVIKIFTSPLSRALETARIIKAELEGHTSRHIPLIVEKALAERSFEKPRNCAVYELDVKPAGLVVVSPGDIAGKCTALRA